MEVIIQALIKVFGNSRFQGTVLGFIVGAIFVFTITNHQITNVNFLGIKFVNTIKEIENLNAKINNLEKSLSKQMGDIQQLKNKIEDRETNIFQMKQRLAAVETELDVTKNLANLATLIIEK